jgi:antirestriction protein
VTASKIESKIMTTNDTTLNKTRQNDTPSIYVADLADYNAGILRGTWIEITEETTRDSLLDAVHLMLREKGHEEWAIHDYENLPDYFHKYFCLLGEYPELDDLITIAHAVIEYGLRLVEGFLDKFQVDQLDSLEDHFRGFYDSVEDYVRELVDECYNLEKMMGNLYPYFDYRRFARDLELNGEIHSVDMNDGTVAIFSC